MFRRSIRLLLVASLAASALWAADDPFLGEWKLNASKSKYFDQMKVESVGGSKYAFDLGGGSRENVVLDGTDQPGLGDTTLSVSVKAPDSWKVVRKKNGRILLTGSWKLSKDGNTLADEFTSFAPSGSSSAVNLVYKRTAAGSGFAGTWENSTGTVDTGDSAYLLKLQPHEGDGLTFFYSSEGATKNVKLDGKDYPNKGSDARPGSSSSARRVNEHTLELTDKTDGKVARIREVTLSSEEQLRIGIRFYNYAGVSHEQVAAMEEVVERLLKRSHIETEWTACLVDSQNGPSISSPCDASGKPSDLIVYLVGSFDEHYKWVDQKALAYSIIPEEHALSTMAYVSYASVQRLSTITSADVAQLLGMAVAHEIGHLLLGTRSHAYRGIMRADWRLSDLENHYWEDFEFTWDQARQLHSATQARLRSDQLSYAGTRMP